MSCEPSVITLQHVKISACSVLILVLRVLVLKGADNACRVTASCENKSRLLT